MRKISQSRVNCNTNPIIPIPTRIAPKMFRNGTLGIKSKYCETQITAPTTITIPCHITICLCSCIARVKSFLEFIKLAFTKMGEHLIDLSSCIAQRTIFRGVSLPFTWGKYRPERGRDARPQPATSYKQVDLPDKIRPANSDTGKKGEREKEQGRKKYREKERNPVKEIFVGGKKFLTKIKDSTKTTPFPHIHIFPSFQDANYISQIYFPKHNTNIFPKSMGPKRSILGFLPLEKRVYQSTLGRFLCLGRNEVRIPIGPYWSTGEKLTSISKIRRRRGVFANAPTIQSTLRRFSFCC